MVLGIAFTCSLTMRFYPAKYGFFLNEADPFFNYRATNYLLKNGIEAYWKWHDNMSWYPQGRNVAESSQSGLHLTTAVLYLLFGHGFTLLEFTIILPVILGSLSSIVIFALVRSISGGNYTMGLFSSLLFAFSPILIQRGNLGWFKSEPLGLFLGLTALYLIVSIIDRKVGTITIIKACVAGILLGFANTAWGGSQYFIIPISLFCMVLPFLKKDLTNSITFVSITTVLTLVIAGSFPRPGLAFIFGLQGLLLIGSTIYLVDVHYLKKLIDIRRHRRMIMYLAGVFAVVGLVAFIGEAYYTSDFRYLNAINPFTSPQLSITELVAEHGRPTFVDYLVYNSILLFFAGLGAWFCFKSKNTATKFALIIAITGVYVSAGLSRLMVYASIGVIVLAGIGLGELIQNLWHSKSNRLQSSLWKLRDSNKCGLFNLISDQMFELSFVTVIMVILIIPLIFPPYLNWIELADRPPMILDTGSSSGSTSHDWLDALNWISRNTSNDSVITAWWDHGYWITTLGNRTTVADNANFYPARTAALARMFMEPPREGINIARELKSDYILVHVVAHRVLINGSIFYVLGNGGDESKVVSMIGVGGFDEKRFLIGNDFTNEFWTNTLLGSLIPFTKQGYTNFGSEELRLIKEPLPDTYAVYTKQIKYPVNFTSDDRKDVNLVYSSPSFLNSDINAVSIIFVYKLQ
jgi:dolichyl-diphosphooligosaccharide--protein glycosyltransferase